VTEADYRSSHVGKGEDYHAIFSDEAHTALLWSMEQQALADIVAKYFPVEPPAHLDFACGTGRILETLADKVKSSTGVDISTSMLEVAQNRLPDAEIVQVDLTSDEMFAGRRFDLITAFRFFPNAEPALRLQAIKSLSPLLSDRGILVFNNHLNRGSNLRRVVKLTGRVPGHSMSEAEVVELMESGGLRCLENLGLGFLPLLDRHVVAPRAIRAFEWRLRNTRLQASASDRIFVAARNRYIAN